MLTKWCKKYPSRKNKKLFNDLIRKTKLAQQTEHRVEIIIALREHTKTRVILSLNKYAGPAYSRAKMYAACMSRGGAATIDLYLLPAPDLSSKPAGRCCCCRSIGKTDRRTDGRTDTRPFCDAYRKLCGPRNKATDQWLKKILVILPWRGHIEQLVCAEQFSVVSVKHSFNKSHEAVNADARITLFHVWSFICIFQLIKRVYSFRVRR